MQETPLVILDIWERDGGLIMLPEDSGIQTNDIIEISGHRMLVTRAESYGSLSKKTGDTKRFDGIGIQMLDPVPLDIKIGDSVSRSPDATHTLRND